MGRPPLLNLAALRILAMGLSVSCLAPHAEEVIVQDPTPLDPVALNVEVAVTVGAEDGAEGTAQLWVQYLDVGTSISYPVDELDGTPIPFGEEVRFHVPRTRRIGIAAMANDRGAVERIVDLGSMETLEASLRVELALPEVSTPAELRLSVSAPSTGKDSTSDLFVQCRLQSTGITIWHDEVQRERDRFEASVALPAGGYLLDAAPRYFSRASTLMEDIALEPGEVLRIDRDLKPGYTLQATVDVETLADSFDEEWAHTAASLRVDGFPDGVPEEPLVWYGEAEVQRWDPKGRRWLTARTLDWATVPGSHIDLRYFPFGRRITSSQRFVPGEYRIRISGPMVEAHVEPFTLPPIADEFDGWPSAQVIPYSLSLR